MVNKTPISLLIQIYLVNVTWQCLNIEPKEENKAYIRFIIPHEKEEHLMVYIPKWSILLLLFLFPLVYHIEATFV